MTWWGWHTGWIPHDGFLRNLAFKSLMIPLHGSWFEDPCDEIFFKSRFLLITDLHGNSVEIQKLGGGKSSNQNVPRSSPFPMSPVHHIFFRSSPMRIHSPTRTPQTGKFPMTSVYQFGSDEVQLWYQLLSSRNIDNQFMTCTGDEISRYVLPCN